MPDPPRAEPATPDGPTSAPLSHRLRDRWFAPDDHPYCHLEREIERRLSPELSILEVGCGRGAPLLRRYEGRVGERVGIDLVEFTPEALASGARLRNADVVDTGLEPASIDLAWSRAVMEHVEHPERAFAELARVLKPGGVYVFLAPNLGDYTTWISRLVPNRLHPWIVKRTEGRAEEDTFPAFYRSNTFSRVRKLARGAGLEVEKLEYLGQYPNYFLFNPVLFTIAGGYEKLISRFDALGFLRGWLLAVIRKP
jgi:SAM-dependent methyltransferase